MNLASGPEFVYCATPSGHVNLGALLLAAQHFVARLAEIREEIGVTKEEPAVLYMDNLSFHHSHVLEAFLLEEGNCLMRFLLKYTSAVTQPEDVSCMAPFKKLFRSGKAGLGELVTSLTYMKAFSEGAHASTRSQLAKIASVGKVGEDWIAPIIVAAAK